jgi:hypothetical protein
MHNSESNHLDAPLNPPQGRQPAQRRDSQSLLNNLNAYLLGLITTKSIEIISLSSELSIPNLSDFFPVELNHLEQLLNQTHGYTKENFKSLSQDIGTKVKEANELETQRLIALTKTSSEPLAKDLNERLKELKNRLDKTYDQLLPISEQLSDLEQDNPSYEQIAQQISQINNKTANLVKTELNPNKLFNALPNTITPGVLLRANPNLIQTSTEQHELESDTDEEPEEIGVSFTDQQEQRHQEQAEQAPAPQRAQRPSLVLGDIELGIESNQASPPPIGSLLTDPEQNRDGLINSPRAFFNADRFNAQGQIQGAPVAPEPVEPFCKRYRNALIALGSAITLLSAGLAYYYVYIFKEPALLGDVTWDTTDNAKLNFDSSNDFTPSSNSLEPFTNGTLNVVYENSHHWKGKLKNCEVWSEFNAPVAASCIAFLQSLFISIRNPAPGEYLQNIAQFETNEQAAVLKRNLIRENNPLNFSISPINPINKPNLEITLDTLNLNLYDPKDPDQQYALDLTFTDPTSEISSISVDRLIGSQAELEAKLADTQANLNNFKYLTQIRLDASIYESYVVSGETRWIASQSKSQNISLPYLPAPDISIDKAINHQLKLTDQSATRLIPYDANINIMTKVGLPISIEFVLTGLTTQQQNSLALTTQSTPIQANKAYTFNSHLELKQWLSSTHIQLTNNICQTGAKEPINLAIHFSQIIGASTRTKIITSNITALGVIKDPLALVSNPVTPTDISSKTNNSQFSLNLESQAASNSGNPYDPYELVVSKSSNTQSLSNSFDFLVNQQAFDLGFNESLALSYAQLANLQAIYKPLAIAYPHFPEPLGSTLTSQVCMDITNKITAHRTQSCSNRLNLEVVAPNLEISLCKTRVFGYSNKEYDMSKTLCPKITGAPEIINWTISTNINQASLNILTDAQTLAQYNISLSSQAGTGNQYLIAPTPYQLQQFINQMKYKLNIQGDEEVETAISMQIENSLSDPSQINPPPQTAIYRIRPGRRLIEDAEILEI